MNSRATMTPTDRAEADLRETLSGAITDLAVAVALSEETETELREHLDEVIRKAQDVIVNRLKDRAYEVRRGYDNSGADETVDADTWDAAVEAADPAEYDIMWMRTWKR